MLGLYHDLEDWHGADQARADHEAEQAAINADENAPPPERKRQSPEARRPAPRTCEQCQTPFIPDFASAGHDRCLWCRTTGDQPHVA